MDAHNARVRGIAVAVEGFYKRGEKYRVSRGSTNSTRVTKRGNAIDIRDINNVLHIDVKQQTCLVEPNVPMDKLVQETLKHSLLPPVVMEFPGITAGGGYAGTCGESSSFKHGFFDTNINWVEMVLANGQILYCSRSENADLFHGAAGAVGSLGLTTLLELRLVKAKPYVETTYHPIADVAEAINTIRSKTTESHVDYIDGILFSKSQGVVITGRMTDQANEKLPFQCFSGPWDPWFYQHAENKVQGQKGPVIEVVPLAEYLFRYDRGGFWVGSYAFEYFKTPFNAYTRWFLDDFLHTRMMYTALHASRQSNRMVIQDLALPYSSAEAFVDYTNETLNIWPLWLCPLHQSSTPTFHPHSKETEADGKTLKQLLNIGLWGQAPLNADFVNINRDLEAMLHHLGGMKWLYAQTFYTPDEFWSRYDRKSYDILREKYDAKSLPSVYEKVSAEVDAAGLSLLELSIATWPFGGLYGLWKAIESGTYIQARNATWRWTVK